MACLNVFDHLTPWLPVVDFFDDTIFHLHQGLGPAWFGIHFDTLWIRNRINQWLANEWITIHLPLIFYSIWFSIVRLIMIREWKVRRIKIKPNQNESMRFFRFESESKLIRNKKKMIRSSKSKIKMNRRIKLNRFGPSPVSTFNSIFILILIFCKVYSSKSLKVHF